MNFLILVRVTIVRILRRTAVLSVSSGGEGKSNRELKAVAIVETGVIEGSNAIGVAKARVTKVKRSTRRSVIGSFSLMSIS